jgi:hypothetical protein
MPYTINFTDPTKINTITVPDMPPGINTVDTDLSLVGRGYPNYGQKIAQNFVQLLENFSNSTSPVNAIQGQLWYDNNTGRLQINNASSGQSWVPAGGVWQQDAEPATASTGDLWVDTNHILLKIKTNTGWSQVSNTSTGFTGAFATLLTGDDNNPYWVIEHKIQDVTVAIDSDSSFLPNPPIPNFPFQINTGTTITTQGKFWGTAQSSDALNLYYGNQTLTLPTNRFLVKDDLTLPGPGQIITGRVYFQNKQGVVLTTQDDPTGSNNGVIQLVKSGNNLEISNNINYGNILLNTNFGTGNVRINSTMVSKSTATGALVVDGGVGIHGDLHLGGSLYMSTVSNFHYTTLVTGFADNIFGGQAGNLIYQITTGTTGFVSTGSTGSILVSGGNQVPFYITTSSMYTGHAAQAENITGGSADQFVIQTAPNKTGFVSTANIYVKNSVYADNLAGGATNSIPVQSNQNVTTFIPIGQPGDILGVDVNGTPAYAAPTAGGSISTAIADAIKAAVPMGVILLWSGSSTSIPANWALCDGTNGTPDLRDRFVVGAGNAYAVAATGGSTDAIVPLHDHTASSSASSSASSAATSVVTDPQHDHTFTLGFGAVNNSYSGGGQGLFGGGNVGYTTDNASTGITVATSVATSVSTDVSTTVNQAGQSATNANLPPYYALCYIMKTV